MQQLFQQLLQILTTCLLLYIPHIESKYYMDHQFIILLFMPPTKGKSIKPSTKKPLNIKKAQFNGYSNAQIAQEQEGYSNKYKKKMRILNTRQNKSRHKTNSKLIIQKKSNNFKQVTKAKYGKIQIIKQKINPSKLQKGQIIIKHNPQQQVKGDKKLIKKPSIKQNQAKNRPSQLQMINLAKSIINKIKDLKPDNQLVDQCKELDKKIGKEKIVSKQSSCRIFKLADLALSMAPKRESMNEQQQVLQRAQIIEQIDPKWFQCKILYDYEDFRQYLIQIMSKQCGKVTRTELIYRYDIYNKVNIHNYIDNKPKLLFIVQTQQDFIIAAYTQAPFQVNTIPNAKSFIASLTNRRYYRKISDKKSLIYDNIYVVFGNSDLRIKGDQVFSNLGLNNSSYDSRGERCHALFGEGTKNTTVIKQMQVFQVTF